MIKTTSYHCYNAITHFPTLGAYTFSKITLFTPNGTDGQNLGLWLTAYLLQNLVRNSCFRRSTACSPFLFKLSSQLPIVSFSFLSSICSLSQSSLFSLSSFLQASPPSLLSLLLDLHTCNVSIGVHLCVHYLHYISYEYQIMDGDKTL